MALAEIDDVWLACARALDLPIDRTGDAYVTFDGTTLHIAGDDALDHDDSLAQLVLHEICHVLVQGPDNRHVADWGLHNTGDDATQSDEVRERAAVRLQAHLAFAFGLYARFFPTTVVRPFYEALGRRPLDEDADDRSLSRAAATRAGHAPYREALSRALAASAERLHVPLHRSGAALDAAVRCGDCAWRAESGHCRAADARVFVERDEIGCSRHTSLDCRACGACCRSGYDAVPASARSAIARRHPALVVARGDGIDLRRTTVGDEDRCAALAGELAGPYTCTAYEDRPPACADLAAGSRACFDARRRVGLAW